MCEIFENIIAVLDYLASKGWSVKSHPAPHFTAMEFPGNRLIAVPNQGYHLFRGESGNFPKSNPTLYRKEWCLTEKIEFDLQMYDFIQVLNDHPRIKESIEAGVAINYKGLAQHYGLRTNILDLTNSSLVAAFFATTDYDSETDTYAPITDNTRVGVLYFNSIGYMNNDFNPRNSIWPIGLEALRRPGEQRGFSIEMGEGDDLNKIPGFQKFVFRQSASVSEQIYKMTKSGQMLFPYDPMANKARAITQSRVYTKSALESVVNSRKYIYPYDTIKSLLEDVGCTFVDSSPYLYTEDEIKFIFEDMEQQASDYRVTTRLCFHPKN